MNFNLFEVGALRGLRLTSVLHGYSVSIVPTHPLDGLRSRRDSGFDKGLIGYAISTRELRFGSFVRRKLHMSDV